MANNPFAEWLQSEMNKRGLSQANIAREAGVTRAAINGVLVGVRGPGNDLCLALARAFRFPPEVVFRAAGLLPPALDKRDPRLEKIEYILPGLPERDRDEILAFVELKLRLAEQRGEYNPSINQ